MQIEERVIFKPERYRKYGDGVCLTNNEITLRFKNMSKTKSNIPKSKRGGYDFWGRRPGSGFSPMGKIAKRIIHRIERRFKRKIIDQELKDL